MYMCADTGAPYNRNNYEDDDHGAVQPGGAVLHTRVPQRAYVLVGYVPGRESRSCCPRCAAHAAAAAVACSRIGLLGQRALHANDHADEPNEYYAHVEDDAER